MRSAYREIAPREGDIPVDLWGLFESYRTKRQADRRHHHIQSFRSSYDHGGL